MSNMFPKAPRGSTDSVGGRLKRLAAVAVATVSLGLPVGGCSEVGKFVGGNEVRERLMRCLDGAATLQSRAEAGMILSNNLRSPDYSGDVSSDVRELDMGKIEVVKLRNGMKRNCRGWGVANDSDVQMARRRVNAYLEALGLNGLDD